MRRFRLLSLPIGKDPLEWSDREQRLLNIILLQGQKDHAIVHTLRNNPLYDQKWVYVFRGEVIAADKDVNKARKAVEQLGGEELCCRCAFGYISSSRPRFIIQTA